MTKITYLDDCGFTVKTPEALLVFDYYRDPAHAVVKELEHNPDLPVVFFVSNKHQHHYNHEIFNLGQNHKRVDVLSNDVLGIANTEEPTVGRSAGDKIEDVMGGLTVQAFETAEAGVAFVVTTKEGLRIFHGGDLNAWHFDEPTDRRDVQKITAKFQTAVGRIAEAVPAVDIAFFAVDPREGHDAPDGAVQFIEKVKTANLIPMHFHVKDPEACDFRTYPVPADSETRFHCLTKPGQEIRI